MANLPCEEGVIRTAAEAPEQTRGGVWVLAAMILGSGMVFIDGTVVNVALPALQSALNATVTDVQWVVEAYALFLAALLLGGGSLGDLYGRRRVLGAGVGSCGGVVAGWWCWWEVRWVGWRRAGMKRWFGGWTGGGRRWLRLDCPGSRLR